MLKTMSQRAARSFKGAGQQEEVFVDPATIMLMASVVSEIVKRVRKCRQSDSVPESAQKPTMFEKAVVKRITRRKMGIRKYLRDGKKVMKAVFDVGAGSTGEEIQELYDEV